MLWLLQSNYVDSMTSKLAWALRRLGRPLQDFGMGFEPFNAAELCDASEPHFFYGSTGMLRQVQETPAHAANLFGTGAALDQRTWLEHRAADLLNADVEFIRLDDLLTRGIPVHPFFVRPAIDQKAFAGGVVEGQDMSPVYRGRRGRVREQPDDLLLAVSPLVEGIVAEYRFVVLDGVVRLGSRYRHDNRLAPSAVVPGDVLAQAQRLARGWLPCRFTVMDVAVLSDGTPRIVEFNSVHSAGLYDIDPEAFVLLAEEASSKACR